MAFGNVIPAKYIDFEHGRPCDFPARRGQLFHPWTPAWVKTAFHVRTYSHIFCSEYGMRAEPA